MADRVWDGDMIAMLAALWDEGHSTAEIGRRVGVSKNAIISKAHRLDLPPRPSPIIRGGPTQAERRRATPRPTGSTLPPLPPMAHDTAPKPILLPMPPKQIVTPIPKWSGRVMQCTWPIGEPGTRGFHYCDSKSVPGKVYCQDHCDIAFVKARPKEAEIPHHVMPGHFDFSRHGDD